MKMIAIALLLLSPTIFVGQNLPETDLITDSLVDALNETKEDSVKFVIYCGLVKHEYENTGNTDKAFDYANKALEIAFKLDRNDDIATCYTNLAFLYDKTGDVVKALKAYELSISYRTKINDLENIASINVFIGEIYWFQEMYDEALKSFNSSLSYFKQTKDDYNTALVLNKIGGVHQDLKKYDTALDAYRNSLVFAKKDSKYAEAHLYSSMASCFRTMENNDSAIYYYEKSIATDSVYIAFALLGEIYGENGEYEKSIAYLDIGSRLAMLYRGVSAVLKIEHSKSKVYYDSNQLNKAKEIAILGLEKSKKNGSPTIIMRFANILKQISLDERDFEQAYYYRDLEFEMKDSLTNKDMFRKATMQHVRHEFEKEKILKENEAKEQARILAEETSRRNNLQYSLIFLGILLLFGIVLSLGFIKVSANVAEGLIFFAFLILFEFVLVFVEPYLETYTNGEPMYNLLANSIIALLIFPLHDVLESKLKKRLVKKS
jgi:tetratricopeptide (TPR) repeat protein